MATKINVGVVGATGLVGEVFLKLLQERKFPISELRPFASDKSVGQKINFNGNTFNVQALKPGCFEGLELVFFSSGDDISKEWAPQAVAAGAFAVDNSAAFRMDKEIPLVVPEINSHRIPKRTSPAIIANPNCSTIQMVMVLHPLAKRFGIENVHVASYQAVSGAGKIAREELLTQSKELLNGATSVKPEAFAHQIAFNCLPHIGSFNDQGFSSEEVKIIKESKKILELPDIKVSAFTVRIPSLNAHSEALWVRLKKMLTRDEVVQCLSDMPGVQIIDSPKQAQYPTAVHASGSDPVYVGRIHQDIDDPNTWMFWVVSDNLRKGAALNGIQIAEYIFSTPV